ncbi:tyrosine-type recombinase/integrase [Mesorhizobium sp. M4B.F.Ca.ET.058.02.1.1]|uniref:tyrosine-type recombinase/integrase n=1 Tax=Mesorhizobium sp. M4B.F.Ca.ET.058.02.1.1 TaxID=2493675 RepID=UPI000F76070D|nr:tyrosine-type recombinase/integrase [Mesorhizobium sp. M4B.F.Ca.ET.058.02.1.1]AZO48092.1 integrase [Mesorhizobium sp. M4B.F.Ca.ET.058.02.1.1]
MLVKIKGIHKVKMTLADGSKETYYYAWRGGPRMKEKPHTEAFSREHARLREKAAETVKVILTLDHLIEHFTGPEHQRNPDFLVLAESTRVDHLYAYKLVRKHWPECPLAFTQAKGFKGDIRKWHRSMRANPRKADKALFSLSKAFSYAIETEYQGIEKNPCTGINRLYEGSRKEFLWTQEQIELARAKLEPHLLLPFEIALATGQRQGDILAMSWKQWDGKYLQFAQSKTGKKLKVLANTRIKTMLDTLLPANKDKLRICLNSRGRPWTKDGFKSSWGKAMSSEEINIEGVTYHDLRGTFICERAREGSSIEDITRISGHSMAEIRSVLEKHYLATDQGLSDAVILRSEKNP